MKPARFLTTSPSRPILFKIPRSGSTSNVVRWVYGPFRPPCVKFPVACMATSSAHDTHLADSPPKIAEVGFSGRFSYSPSPGNSEEIVEKVIYNCRFLTLFAVLGSLFGSFLCFMKGCAYVVSSFQEYFVSHGRGIFMLVEAIDVYLLGTVMLVFGMGLYELFISNLDIAKSSSKEATIRRSNLFGLFILKERPKWLEIKSVNELKTKLGHVIVMILLIGLFEKSKKAAILTPIDLLCFAGSVLLSSCSLYLLARLH